MPHLICLNCRCNTTAMQEILFWESWQKYWAFFKSSEKIGISVVYTANFNNNTWLFLKHPVSKATTGSAVQLQHPIMFQTLVCYRKQFLPRDLVDFAASFVFRGSLHGARCAPSFELCLSAQRSLLFILWAWNKVAFDSLRQITLGIVGYHFSSRLTATLNICSIYLKLLVYVL